ncbi:hypothetical protein [Shewanella sp. GXUN23E]|uniref:hypothetical protein n=1 Tax=Shewanella sp. GXUN23E TaxID=3422498 RepID=UPI003D7F10C9
MKIYIYSRSYDENSGGIVVLHRLCHLINNIDGYSAYLVPNKVEGVIDPSIKNFFNAIRKTIKYKFRGTKKFKTNPLWDTPVVDIDTIDNNSLVIYPEITIGNPLRAKNVVRWFLHQPGYFTKNICFGNNELYYKFNSAINDFEHSLSSTSKNELKVIYYPLDIYNCEGVTKRDIECCHLVRKGSNKKHIHPNESICIDGMSHKEIADIFRRSKRFISYDNYTAYSIFAVLCGCESVVVPEEGWSKIDWYPNEQDRYGIAFGFDKSELDWAKSTSSNVLKHIVSEHIKTNVSVKRCLDEMINHFNL